MSNLVETKQQNELATYSDNMLMDVAAMNHMMNVATFMAGGTMTLPQPYQKNPANCLAVVMQAAQWRMNPYAVAQKTHFVNGNIGYEAQLVSAVIQQSGAVNGMFKFEWFGPWEKIVGKFVERESKKKEDENGFPKKYKYPAWTFDDEEGVGIKVSATLKGETEPRELTLLLKQATTRNSTLWADDPKQQIAYLAQKRWARLYCPGVILGVYTRDELESIEPEKDVTQQGSHEPAAQTYLTDDLFKSIADKHRQSIVSGEKTADRLIAWVEGKGALLTDAQKQLVKSWEQAQTAPRVVEGEAKEVDPFVAEMEAAEQTQGA